MVQGEGYKLILGDCLDAMADMPSGSVDFAFVDPPYNVGKDYGRYKDNRPEGEYFAWCEAWLAELKRIANGRVAIYPPKIHLLRFWNMIPENHQIICAWSPEGAIRGNYVHQYIPLLVPSKPVKRTKDHWWNVQVPGLGYFYREEIFDNPGQTSLDITKRIIEAFTNPGDLILDCFTGTGTTGVVAIQTGRRFIGCELDEEHFQTSHKRLEDSERAMRGLPKLLTAGRFDYAHMPLFMEAGR